MTGLPHGYDLRSLHALEVLSAPVPRAPRYENRYDAGGNRTQHLLSRGSPLDPALLDQAIRLEADLLLIAPAFHEIRAWPAVTAPVRAVALQGLLRAVAPGGVVRPTARTWSAARAFVQPGSFLFLSEEDTPAADALATRAAAQGATVAVTRGQRGVSLFAPVGRRDTAAYPATEIDPTGAGDCFASAFLVRWVETASLDDALAFGLAAGALAAQGRGIQGIPSRDDIETLVQKVAA